MRRCVLAILVAMAMMTTSVAVASPQEYRKIAPGMPMVFFDLVDLNHQRWASNFLRGRPVVILTAHRDLRYEVLKWAVALKRDFGDYGLATVLWVQNLSHIPWTTGRRTVVDQWRSFQAPIPVLLDWNAVIGRALRINYRIPNIILVDADGIFVDHDLHMYSPEVYMAVARKVHALVGPAVGAAKFPIATPGPVPPDGNVIRPPLPGGGAPRLPLPGGRRGDSQ